MTIAEKLRREGFGQGLEQGLEKGKEQAMVQTCQKLLLSGADIKFIEKITSFSTQRIREIEACMSSAATDNDN